MQELHKIILQGVIHQISIIPLEDFEDAVKQDAHSLSMNDALGVMIDPTGYRDALQSGELEFIRVQAEIMVKMRDIRKLINEMQEHNDRVLAYREKRNGR